MKVIKQEGKRPIKAWVRERREIRGGELCIDNDVPDIEQSALDQLNDLAGLPFIHPNGIAVMPDVHWGVGATVGSVIATEGAIIPAAVGVDIGCGMNAIKTNVTAADLPDNLRNLRDLIEQRVPVGFGEHRDAQDMPSEMGSKLMGIAFEHLHGSERDVAKAYKQLGTLGGGNHFIEVCLDNTPEQNVWIMLHSGSRGIGNIIGRHFIEKAKLDMEKYFISLPNKDQAYLVEDTKNFVDYVNAVGWAQDYALVNRQRMMKAVRSCLCGFLKREVGIVGEAVNCHHNYIAREHHFGKNLWVTRKGAIRARQGDMGIIPGSMGQRSYIVRGKGNLESYCSCSHGAGRRMGRKEAGKHFSVKDLVAQTAGVECRKDAGVLDEIPGAYKDIDVVMENQRDLVEVVATLKQVLCVKG